MDARAFAESAKDGGQDHQLSDRVVPHTVSNSCQGKIRLHRAERSFGYVRA